MFTTPWQKQLGLLSVCMSALLSFGVARGADVYVEEYGDIRLFGPIERGDLESVLDKSVESGYRPRSIALYSPGGSVYEAMALGRLADHLSLTCHAVSQCDSACTIILAGCPERNGNGTIGMHRPRFDRQEFSAMSLTEAEEAYDAMLSELRAYMSDMAIPEAVVERMLRTPSNRADRIPAEQFVSMIGNRRPAFDEWLISRCGSLEPNEERDLDVLRNADLYKALVRAAQNDEPYLTRQDLESMRDLEAYYEQKQQFSAGYIEYLNNRRNEVNDCEQNAKSERAEREWRAIISNR